jgi:general secretion pathway protein K
MRLTDTLVNWRSPLGLVRPNGASPADYNSAGLKYAPTNAPFETVSEASKVLGMPPSVFARIAPSLTVYSRIRGINPATASRNVLLALPTATPESVDAFIAARAEAMSQGLSVSAAGVIFPPAAGFTGASGVLWRIKATATLADGVAFTREAVVRPSQDLRRPLIILAWLESDDSLAPAASTSDATTDANARS